MYSTWKNNIIQANNTDNEHRITTFISQKGQNQARCHPLPVEITSDKAGERGKEGEPIPSLQRPVRFCLLSLPAKFLLQIFFH